MSETATNWPFGVSSTSASRPVAESYAPTSPEYEQEIAEARKSMAATSAAKERVLEELRVATMNHDASIAHYRHVIRRLNEWRESLKAAGAA
jgi:hypothetical protein